MRDLATNPTLTPAPASTLTSGNTVYTAMDADGVRKWVASTLADLKADPSRHLLSVDVNYSSHWKDATADYLPWMNVYANLTVRVWNSTHKKLVVDHIGIASLSVNVPVLMSGCHTYPVLAQRAVELLRDAVVQNIANGKLEHAVLAEKELCKEIVSESVRDAVRTEAVLELVEVAKESLVGGNPQKNDKVEVYKGRKVPVGTVGQVKWVGSNRFGASVGMQVAGTDSLVFVSIGNVRVLVDDATIMEEAKKYYRQSGYESVFGPIREAA